MTHTGTSGFPHSDSRVTSCMHVDTDRDGRMDTTHQGFLHVLYPREDR